MPQPLRTIILLVALLGTVLGIDAYHEHQKTLLSEQQRLVSLAGALKSNIGEQLRASSRMLDALRLEVGSATNNPNRVAELSTKMSLLSESIVGIRSLLLIDSEGIVLSSNRPELVGKNFKGSERYQLIKTGNQPEMLYISQPFETPMGLFTTSLGKVLVDAEGRFNGYVLAILDPAYFSVLMQSLLYAEDMRISVIHGDGKVIFSTQKSPSFLGIDLSQRPDSLFYQHYQSNNESTFKIERNTATEDIRLTALQNVSPATGVAHKQLVVAVSRNSDAVLAEWKKYSFQQLFLFIGLILAITVSYHIHGNRKRSLHLLKLEKSRIEDVSKEILRATNEQFRGYFENITVGAVLLDPDGRFKQVNDSYCEMTGFSREELVGKMYPFWLTYPDDRPVEKQQMAELLSGNGQSVNLEIRLLRKDSQVIWVRVSARAVRNQSGETQFITEVIENITLQKDLISELETAKLAAEAGSRAKTLFLGNMSHEMRTPLHQIMGVVGMLRRDPLTNEQLHRLGLLENAATRLETVIGGILTLVDLESGSAEIALAPMDMKQVVGDIATMLEDIATEKNLSLCQEIMLPDYRLMGDARHIRTILSCYCNNALTFSNHGTITIRAEMVDEEAGSIKVRLAVQDQGVGISTHNLGRLFENFEQVDTSRTRKYGGTGIGLATVKKLAKLMGGDAGCESTVGVGSTFWATIKLVKEIPGTEMIEDYQI